MTCQKYRRWHINSRNHWAVGMCRISDDNSGDDEDESSSKDDEGDDDTSVSAEFGGGEDAEEWRQ